MILIIENQDTRRLCKDGYFRDFATFGTFKDCVKIYKSLGQALHVAKKLSARVVNIPDNMMFNASGTVTEEIPCPDKEGYSSYVRRDILEFVVKSS